ncbi:MAG: bifunctional metallophosphatase/5'-nucleotidase [Acidobacteriota bacterium]
MESGASGGGGADRSDRKRLIPSALLTVVLAVAAGGAADAERATTLTVLFTSDVHGRVLPFDDVRERPARGSLAQVATLVARVREEARNVVVLDGGDAIQGTPLAYYGIAAPGAAGEDPTVAGMNAVGVDAAVLGNHEFNFGLEILGRSIGQSSFPWLAANLKGAAAAGLSVGDEIVITRGGVRIGVLGLTNPNIPRWDPPGHWRGLEFLDPIEIARRRLATLRARADIVVVVAHTGFERDLDSGEGDDSEHENFAYRLAQLEGIDLLLTGHTHRDIAPRQFGRTVIAQPGRWAEYVTRVDLSLTRVGRRWRVEGWQGSNLPTGEESADPRVTAAVAGLHERVNRELARPLGTLAAPLRLAGAPTADDPSVDLVHAVQLEATGAQLSLAAPLGGREEFPAGPLTPRLAHALYPYPNTLTVVRLSGAQLKDVLEHAVHGWVGVECAVSGCVAHRDGRVPVYSFDTLAGGTYLVDPQAPAGKRIRGLRVEGRLVGAEETFTVAINSYRAVGGGHFPHLDTAPRVAEIDRPMVELLVDFFARRGTVTPGTDDNWAFTLPLREAVQARPAAR